MEKTRSQYSVDGKGPNSAQVGLGLPDPGRRAFCSSNQMSAMPAATSPGSVTKQQYDLLAETNKNLIAQLQEVMAEKERAIQDGRYLAGWAFWDRNQLLETISNLTQANDNLRTACSEREREIANLKARYEKCIRQGKQFIVTLSEEFVKWDVNRMEGMDGDKDGEEDKHEPLYDEGDEYEGLYGEEDEYGPMYGEEYEYDSLYGEEDGYQPPNESKASVSDRLDALIAKQNAKINVKTEDANMAID